MTSTSVKEAPDPADMSSYTYDLDGRQTAAASRSFTWAQPDRLASTTASGTTTIYTYDGDGLRTPRWCGATARARPRSRWTAAGAPSTSPTMGSAA